MFEIIFGPSKVFIYINWDKTFLTYLPYILYSVNDSWKIIFEITKKSFIAVANNHKWFNLWVLQCTFYPWKLKCLSPQNILPLQCSPFMFSVGPLLSLISNIHSSSISVIPEKLHLILKYNMLVGNIYLNRRVCYL